MKPTSTAIIFLAIALRVAPSLAAPILYDTRRIVTRGICASSQKEPEPINRRVDLLNPPAGFNWDHAYTAQPRIGPPRATREDYARGLMAMEGPRLSPAEAWRRAPACQRQWEALQSADAQRTAEAAAQRTAEDAQQRAAEAALQGTAADRAAQRAAVQLAAARRTAGAPPRRPRRRAAASSSTAQPANAPSQPHPNTGPIGQPNNARYRPIVAQWLANGGT
jgi:hypothetical protein